MRRVSGARSRHERAGDSCGSLRSFNELWRVISRKRLTASLRFPSKVLRLESLTFDLENSRFGVYGVPVGFFAGFSFMFHPPSLVVCPLPFTKSKMVLRF